MMRVCSYCRQPRGNLTRIRIDAAVSLTAWLCRSDKERLEKRRSVRRWIRWGWWTRVTG